jgi:ATP-dependent Lon protease
MKNNGLNEDSIDLSDSALRMVIRRYTREAGVRNLEREVATVCRKVARSVAESAESHKKAMVTARNIADFLGVAKFRFGVAEEEDRVGMTTGLAWTEVGGDILSTEVTVLPGRGKLTITGKLGDVMQESAQAAMSYVRSRALQFGLNPDFYSKIDIHIHVPEGAIPKDGPSAGITMCTSIVSALLQIPVKRDVAMTGEITLRGAVLPIGGLKEKLLAAHRGGIKTVVIPLENEKDLKDIPKKIFSQIRVYPVGHMDDVLKLALALDGKAPLFKTDRYTIVVPEIYAKNDGEKTAAVIESTTPAAH